MIREYLKRISWLRGLHTFWYVRVVQVSERIIAVLRARHNYHARYATIRSVDGRKIRILFPLQELAKWKLQTVVEKLRDSKRFEPIVAFTIADIWWNKSTDEITDEYERIRVYFGKHHIECVSACDILRKRVLSFQQYQPDVVFYQQPWRYDSIQMPVTVSKYALTFYVPYYTPNYSCIELECGLLFHRTLFRYFVLNDNYAQDYRNYLGNEIGCAGDFVSVGHPMLDQIAFDGGVNCKGTVIYAPHWSFPHANNVNKENYSTFLETGRVILKFAKDHPEINWAFKPHPTLRLALLWSKAWSQDEVEKYYNEWAEVGEVCATGSYLELFAKSRAMITDCGSFLTEYACTGKPIIHLISSSCKVPYGKALRPLYMTYYRSTNVDELNSLLNEVIANGNDFRKDERHRALAQAGVMNSRAAENIVNYMCNLLLKDR